MKRRFLYYPSPLGVVASIVFFSLVNCGKDINQNYFEEETVTENAAIGQNEAYDILEVDYQAEVLLKTSDSTIVHPGNCITYSNSPAAKILTLDFGAIGVCLGPFPLNRVRSGKIFVSYSSTIADTTAHRTITFDNYVVNNKRMEGTFEFSPMDTTSAGKMQGICKFTNLKVTFPNGTSMTFNGNQTRIWESGEGDGDPTNNTYQITGDSLTGVTSSNRSFRADITTVVFANFSCAIGGYFARESGVMELSKLEGYPDRKRTVDYHNLCTNTIEIITYRRTYALTVN